MRSLLAFAVPSLLVPLATAQVTVSLTTITPIAVLHTQPASFTGVPAGVPADNLWLRSTTYPVGGTEIRCQRGLGTHGTAFRLNSNVILLPGPGISTGTSASPMAGGATFGQVEVLARIQGAPGTTGHLEINFYQAIVNSTANLVSQGEVDIDADGTPDVTAPTFGLQVPRTIGSTGELLVRLALTNHATGSTTTSSIVNLLVDFVPAPISNCTITPYGAGCGGVTSAGSEATVGYQRTITLWATGGFPQAPVLSVLGTSNVPSPLPGGCVLHNDALAVMLLAADPAGSVVQSLLLPATALGTVYQQFVPLDLATLTIRASNGLDITCVP